jgi:hypothetical protein
MSYYFPNFGATSEAWSGVDSSLLLRTARKSQSAHDPGSSVLQSQNMTPPFNPGRMQSSLHA